MHWLLLLAVLSSTTGAKSGSSSTQLNRLAENALRQQLGTARAVQVAITPGKNGTSDFDAMTVSLDGFSADHLAGLANRAVAAGNSASPDVNRNINSPGLQLKGSDLGIGDLGSIFNGGLGDVLGGVLSGKEGRIGHLRLNATNFTFSGARYDVMRADLGEIRFDWGKALRGNFAVKSIQPGNLLVQLQGDQAAKLLAPRLPSLQDVRVRFSGGRAYLAAKANYYGLNMPFEVGAQLSVQQNQVLADNFGASVASLRLPALVINQLTKNVNPLYDFDPQKKLPLVVNLRTAGTANNALSMQGGIQWLGFQRDSSYSGGKTADSDSNRYPADARSQTGSQNRDVFGNVLGGIFRRH